ncbi:MAG: hypothetical protein WAO55_05600 [Candidatus Manganitrophaceae bacterium]
MNLYYSNSASKSMESNAKTPHSVRSRAWRGAMIAAVGVFVSLGMAGSVGAAGLACNANFSIKNEKNEAVKVLSLIYKVDGKDHTEGLSNKKLAPGEDHTWKNQSLGKLAEGNAMEMIRIEYQNDTSGEGKLLSDPWGPAVKTIWFRSEVEGDCTKGRTYTLKIP